MESLGLSQKDAQSRNKWRRRIKGQPANPGSPGKMEQTRQNITSSMDVIINELLYLCYCGIAVIKYKLHSLVFVI